MKKFLGAIFILYVIYSIHHYLDDRHIRNTSQPFATQAAAVLADGWNPAVFDKYADDSLKGSKQIAANFLSYRKLGKLQKAPDCTMQDTNSYKYSGTNATYVGVTYQCEAEFENAPAVIQLTMSRYLETAPWKINSFNLISSYFTPAKR